MAPIDCAMMGPVSFASITPLKIKAPMRHGLESLSIVRLERGARDSPIIFKVSRLKVKR